jgi:hypothetical protein
VYEHEPDSLIAALATPWFRIASSTLVQDELEWLYEESAHRTRSGLFGHVAGKTFVRIGMDLASPAIHKPRPAEPSLQANRLLPGLALLHFHALDFTDWLEKWQRRASGQVRIKGQQAARLTDVFRNAYKSGGPETARELYRQWYVPGLAKLLRAESAGLVRRTTRTGQQYRPLS